MTISVRRMRFDFPDDLDPIFIEGEPEDSYQHIALSLLLPYLEPYLIRTMRAARPRVTDPALVKDLDAFVEQEGQHYRQHAAFNRKVRGRGFDEAVAPLERELDEDYRRFSRDKSLEFNLAYASAFEAFTAATAWLILDRDTSKWHPSARDLFLWHIVEELEHRTVAFEVYEHVCGNYAQRVRVGAFAQMHLVRFVERAWMRLLSADPRVLAQYGGVVGRFKRMAKLRASFVRKVMPRAIASFSPRYDPRDIELPASTQELTKHYTETAISAS